MFEYIQKTESKTMMVIQSFIPFKCQTYITRSNDPMEKIEVIKGFHRLSQHFSGFLPLGSHWNHQPLGPGPRSRSLGATGTLPAAAGGRPGAGWQTMGKYMDCPWLSWIVWLVDVGWCWLMLDDVGWVGWVGGLVGLCNDIFFKHFMRVFDVFWAFYVRWCRFIQWMFQGAKQGYM